MSISSYLILRRAARRPRGATLTEPLWSRWYMPLVAVALALLALIVAAVAALEIVARTHQRPAQVTRPARADPGSRPEPGSHVELGPDVELLSTER